MKRFGSFIVALAIATGLVGIVGAIIQWPGILIGIGIGIAFVSLWIIVDHEMYSE